MQPTAKITKGKKGKGLYLLTSSEFGDYRFAITEEEVSLIRDACEEWLEQESQRIMAESLL